MYESYLHASMEERPIKVLVIMGSARKGNTYRAAERIREILEEEAPVDWEYVMLKDVGLEQCRGCYTCFEWGEEFCPIKDDSALLEAKMHAADGVIFATPVYGFQVSGLMKVFIDRHSYIFHRPRFFRQKALLLTTVGVMGGKDVLDYLNTVARVWGFEVAGRAAIVSHAKMGPLPAYRLRRTKRKLQAAAKAFSPRSGEEPAPGRALRRDGVSIGGRPATSSANWLPQITPTGRSRGGSRREALLRGRAGQSGLTMRWARCGVYLRRQIRRDLREVGEEGRIQKIG